MKFVSKKITAAILAFVFIFSGMFSLAVSADNYPYVDNNPQIATTESFEEFFSATKIKKISYDYSVVELDSSNLLVALVFETKIGTQSYFATANGVIKSFDLPSGNVFWEGPIDGAITIDGVAHKIIVGFSLLESTDELMISVTMNGSDVSPIAFSFGKNIIEGEVLDLFMERIGNYTGRETSDDNKEDTTPSSESNPGNMSRLVGLPDPILPYDPPSDEETDPDLNLGANGEYKYQSAEFARWGTSTYKAFESNVYLCREKWELLVTIKPAFEETQMFAQTLDYDSVTTALGELKIEVNLDDEAAAENYTRVTGIHIPASATITENGFVLDNDLFVSFLEYSLNKLGIDQVILNAIHELAALLKAKVYGNDDDMFYAYVCADTFYNAELLDEVSTGFLAGFGLTIIPQYYTGNTEYTVTTSAKYFVIGLTDPLLSEAYYTYFYLESSAVHTGFANL